MGNRRTGGQTTSKELAEPPEGVIAGENVPPESEPDEYDENLLARVKARLKSHGEPYTEMNDSELEEAAKKYIDKHKEDN